MKWQARGFYSILAMAAPENIPHGRAVWQRQARKRFGDPENLRSSSERFLKIPNWPVDSRHFAGLKIAEIKLLVYLSRYQNNDTHTTRRYTLIELSGAIGCNRNATSRALETLTMLGFIATEKKGRKVAAQILFRDPSKPRQEEEAPIKTRLDARLLDCDSPSEQRNNFLRSTPGIVAQNARNSGVSDYPADWDSPEFSEGLEGGYVSQ